MSRFLFVLAVVSSAGAALAAPPERDQGDWPCKQIKVPDIALAAIWTGPAIEEAEKTWRDDSALADLVARLAARRTPMETAEQSIADFAKSAGPQRKERLTQLFAGVYDRLDVERRDVISGLDRYGRTQKESAERLRQKAEELRAAQDAKADPEKLKQLSEALNWDMRIFEERRKAVTYVCESPALIEQRLGALARTILAAME